MSDSTGAASRKVAFIGLGVMGYHMAGHLSKAGHDVTVYNRTGSKAERWIGEFEGRKAATPGRGRRGERDRVRLRGQRRRRARSVTTGEGGAFGGMDPGAVFVDHTTASADVARELAAAASERGLGFMDAPVSGGEAGAVNGVLTVMVGGEPAVFDRCRDVIAAYARARHPARSGRLRPAHQDGQPDLHRRGRAGTRRGAEPRAALRARPQARARRHLERRRAVLADGEPRDHDGGRRVRLRVRGGLDAQGPSTSASRRATVPERCCPSPRWSTSSTRGCRRAAADAGTPPA